MWLGLLSISHALETFSDRPSIPTKIIRCCGTVRKKYYWVCGSSIFLTAAASIYEQLIERFKPSLIGCKEGIKINLVKNRKSELSIPRGYFEQRKVSFSAASSTQTCDSWHYGTVLQVFGRALYVRSSNSVASRTHEKQRAASQKSLQKPFIFAWPLALPPLCIQAPVRCMFYENSFAACRRDLRWIPCD